MILLTGTIQPYLAVMGRDESSSFFGYIGNLNFVSLDGKRMATPITIFPTYLSNVDYHYRYDHIAGNFLGGAIFVSSFKHEIKNFNTNYVLSVRYLGHNIKTTKIKFRCPLKDFTKITSSKNYRLYGTV